MTKKQVKQISGIIDKVFYQTPPERQAAAELHANGFTLEDLKIFRMKYPIEDVILIPVSSELRDIENLKKRLEC